jgi:hypothetical protein
LLASCGGDESTPVCSIPLSLEAIEVSDTSAIINWLPTEATSFVIAYKISESLPIEDMTGTTSSASVVLNELAPNTNYEVRVQAICDETTSDFSEVLFFTTEMMQCLPASESISEVIDYNEVFVDWNDQNTATSGEVEYSPSGFNLGEGIVKPANESELLLDALIVGTAYDYYIKTYCEGNESMYSEVFSFITEACEIPTNVEVFNVSSNSVTFNWNAEGQEVWEFEYGLENFELGTGSVVFTETIPTTIDNLDAATRYEFYIRANCGPNGRSEYVGPILVETLL